MSQVGTTHDHPQALVHSMVLWLSFETGSGSAVTRSKGLWCATLSLLLRTKDEHQKKRAWKNRGPWALFLLEAGPHQSGLPPLYHRPTKRSFCPKEGNPCAVHPRVQRNGNSPVIVCTLDTASRQRACTFTIGINPSSPSCQECSSGTVPSHLQKLNGPFSYLVNLLMTLARPAL